MKKVIRIVCAFILLFSIFMILPKNNVEAWDYKTELKSDWTKSGDVDVTDTTTNVVGAIVQVIRIVGTGISVIMLTYVAIKYMSAAPSEKAEFKKSATAFIVGAIVLFGATNILGVISNFAASNIK